MHIPNIQSDQKKRINAMNALDFMRNHPSFNPEILGDSLFDGNWFYMSKCCKRGKSESSRRFMTVYRGQKGWKKFKDKFDREYKDSDEPLEYQNICVSYKEFYNEPWVFDHVEYWYETTFFVYDGDPYDKLACMDYKNWSRHSGDRGGANTFEDALIKQARTMRKLYGSFSHDDFITKTELNNHSKNRMFNDDFLREENGIRSINCEPNPEYLNVTNGMLNLRWLKWFMTTEYCKKEYDFSMEEFKSKVDNLDKFETKSRKKIVKKYKTGE